MFNSFITNFKNLCFQGAVPGFCPSENATIFQNQIHFHFSHITNTYYILVNQALLDHTRSSYELEVLIFLNLQITINIIVKKPLTMTITEGFTEPRPKRSNLSTWGADAFEQVDDKGRCS